MKALPAGSKATSVTCLKRPSSAGSGGLGCFSGAVSSSDASCLRPKTIRTRPCGLNLTTMSDPLSVTQMLSPRSTRTVWPNDQALADLADEFPVGRELEQLRGGRRVRRSRGIAARKNENAPLRIHRDPGHLAEVQVLRQLKRVRSIERNLRHRLLPERGRCEQHEQSDKRAFHDILLLRGFLDAVRRRLRHESIAADER